MGHSGDGLSRLQVSGAWDERLSQGLDSSEGSFTGMSAFDPGYQCGGSVPFHMVSPCGLSVCDGLGFLTARWLDSKVEHPERETEPGGNRMAFSNPASKALLHSICWSLTSLRRFKEMRNRLHLWMSDKILDGNVGPEILLQHFWKMQTAPYFFAVNFLYVCLFPILFPEYSPKYCKFSEILIFVLLWSALNKTLHSVGLQTCWLAKYLWHNAITTFPTN